MRNQTTAKYNIDDFDDLTRFADESFDTNEVDLFQFSGDESSPLTRLKSVILSLDWDITDEYLQELADELAHLAPDWQGDKVAGLYLQGMGKIGKYLRLRGAHAHPNSIKLLLTYFHHFETIVSTPDLSRDQIAMMVHNDVRKFKVLQYQIKLKEESASTEDTVTAGKGLAVSRDTGEAEDSLRNFKAAILELDWEVSDSSLARFSATLQALSEEKIQNKAALILIQGMQALGQYISDERAQAHPEVFNLLHSFHDGLEQILDTGPAAPGQKQKKDILLDRVNRLNCLKTLIAPKDSEIPPAIPIPQVAAPAEPVAPAVPETELVPQPAAEKTTDTENPELQQELARSDEEVFSEIEATDSPETDVAVRPSLAADFPIELDMEEKQPIADSAGIESEIDELFAASSKRAMLSSEEEYPEEELPANAYQAVDDEVSDIFIDTNVGERHGITPALSDVVEDAPLEDSDEPLDMETKIDLDEQLDFLFGESSQGAEHSEPAASLFDEEFEDPVISTQSLPVEEADLSAEAPAEAELFAETDQSSSLFLDDATGEMPASTAAQENPPTTDLHDGDNDQDDEPSLALAHDDLPAALADAERPDDDELLDTEPDAEITSKLDSFFDFADADAEEPDLHLEDTNLFTVEEAPTEAKLEEAAPETEQSVLAPEDTYAALPAALADADIPEEDLFVAEEPADEEITSDLDSFFAAADEEVAPVPPPVAEDAHKEATILDEPAGNLSEAELFGDVVAALSDVELTEELLDNQDTENVYMTEVDEDPVLQNELDNFFDTPPTDQEPTEVEREILAVAPEETDEEYFEEAPLSPTAGVAPLESALADVAFPDKTAGQRIEVNPEIEQLVNSFWDDKPSPTTSQIDPAESFAGDVTVTAAEEKSADEELVALEEHSTEAEPPVPSEDQENLKKQEPFVTETAAIDVSEPVETPPVEAALFSDGQEQKAEEAAIETTEDQQDLFASNQDEQHVLTTESAVAAFEEEELQLENADEDFSLTAESFGEILDSSEVQEFLLSGQDIEDISDEER